MLSLPVSLPPSLIPLLHFLPVHLSPHLPCPSNPLIPPVSTVAVLLTSSLLLRHLLVRLLLNLASAVYILQADWHSGYWVPDTSVECFGGWHRKLSIILGTPLMSLTWVIIPLMPTFLLFRHRHNLSAPQVQLQLGYIYRDYR